MSNGGWHTIPAAAFADVNGGFHEVITQAADTAQVTRLADANRSDTVGRQVARHDDERDICDGDRQHARIVRAIVQRDADEAERTAREHVQLASACRNAGSGDRVARGPVPRHNERPVPLRSSDVACRWAAPEDRACRAGCLGVRSVTGTNRPVLRILPADPRSRSCGRPVRRPPETPPCPDISRQRAGQPLPGSLTALSTGHGGHR